MSDCLFCRIIAREIPSQSVYEDDLVYAFRDIAPQAPVHVLVVPKEHIVSSAEIDLGNSHLVAKCFETIAKLARSENLNNGFRIVANSGQDGGQTVPHLHFHLLGGKPLPASFA